MKTVFYVIASDSHYHGCRTDEFIKSFKKFHPDIDLVVFKQPDIERVFSKHPRINFYNATAAFAKELYNDYELVVKIDADHLIFGRMTEILEGNYDVAIPTNFNAAHNSGIKLDCFNPAGTFASTTMIPYDKYLQAGLVASTSKKFWDELHFASIKYSDLFGNKENDILNLLVHLLPYNIKLLEGDWTYPSSAFNCYYGCASLGRENQIVVNNDRLELDGKPVKAYHFARGGIDKIQPRNLFRTDVVDFIYKNIVV